MQPLHGDLVTARFAVTKIPFADALQCAPQLAKVQFVVLDAVQLQTAGFLDTGTVNFISHLVGVGGDGLAGLGVQALFELDNLSLNLPL